MGRLNTDMQKIAVMQEMGWSYQDYMDAPAYFITLIIEKLKRDRKNQEMAAKRK